MSERVKFFVSPMERGYMVGYRLPIAPAALSQGQVDRLQATLEQAREAMQATVEDIAMAIAQTGACPWCNELLHPSGTSCAETGAGD